MYENDYSWVPSFFGGLMALAAVGGGAISLIRPRALRSRILKVWLLMPVLFSLVLGVVAALFAKNLEPYSPALFVPIFAIIFSLPWLIAACPAYGFVRFIQDKAEREYPTE
jgi:polyferredoxin